MAILLQREPERLKRAATEARGGVHMPQRVEGSIEIDAPTERIEGEIMATADQTTGLRTGEEE